VERKKGGTAGRIGWRGSNGGKEVLGEKKNGASGPHQRGRKNREIEGREGTPHEKQGDGKGSCTKNTTQKKILCRELVEKADEG